jgi:hypothetical protein
MVVQYLKGALTGAVAGAVGGSIVAGLMGMVLISLSWLVQGTPEQLPWAPVFGVLVAPMGASIGVLVGLIVGIFERWFGSLLNAGSFGGALGSLGGVLVMPVLFAGERDLASAVAAVITLALTGVVTAVGVKYLRRRWRETTGA